MRKDRSRDFKLPVRPAILDKESISGFLYRLSKKNHFSTISWFNKFLDLSIYQSQNNDFNTECVSRLCYLINKEVDYFGFSNGYCLKEHLGLELYSKIIMRNKIKFCPVCINENYYHRTIWSFTTFHLCHEHQVMLVDQCTRCYNFISMAAFMDRRCQSCSFEFKKTESNVVKNFIFVESQNQIINGFWDKEYPVVSNNNLNQFFQLAFHSFHLLIDARDYVLMTSNKLSFYHNRANGEKRGEQLANALANVYWMYADFPKHFYIVLDEFTSSNKGTKRYDRLRAFENIFNDINFIWVQEAYNSYFIDQIDKGRVRKDFSVFKKNPLLLAKRKKVRREEVRQSTGIAYEKLHELNDFNEINIEIEMTNGQQRYLVENSTLEGYLSNRQSLISKKEVGLILGVTPDSVQKIVDAGYLTPIQVGKSPMIVYRVQEVQQLLLNCCGEIASELKPTLIKFHDVLIKYSVNSLTIVHIIDFTLSGQLTAYRLNQEGTLADNYYDLSELKCCLDTMKKKRQNEKGLFFNDVMKILKIGEKRLWKILKEQSIPADYILHMKDGRKRYYFKEATVQRIRLYINKSTENIASNDI
ncbi:hypothetical protein A8709_32505 [Paenibacillus pectinilyticus]|uniref:TniQ domain-containing protein n=1 Tax=Paenibacillus pectinilyticus TaxID=512399 RepID=A0A1C0ZWR9_9BACL|nr:TniQ family protein [Paenibacillus pectinilyticus]OCT12545.1 hypothetical protein A8709_32505 [Paenibacillus pectinilyticus]